MSEAIQFIQLDDSEDSLKMMKLMVTAMMKEWQNQVINLDTPKREEYQTEEEFKDAYNEFMMETINDIKGVKKSIFQNINEINSNFLNLKRDTINSFRQENETREKIILGARRTLIMDAALTGAVSLVFNEIAPYIIGLAIPRLGIDVYTMKKNKKRIEINLGVEKRLEELETKLNFLTCDLREDYHKSVEQLEKLKMKLTKGENIIPELASIFDSERVGLPPITEEEFKQIPFEEEPKQYKKENHKN